MTDYFDFFDVKPAFFLDEAALKKKWRENSRKFHPDFAMGNEKASDEAVHMSSLNNEAWKMLSSFDSRVQYILKLHDKPEEGKSLPPDFLMEMMEFNEELVEAGMSGDEEEKKKLEGQIEGMFNELNEEIIQAAKDWDTGNNKEKALDKIEDCYLRKKYLLRIRENLNNFAPL